ncbi:hypothetical protein N7501_005829, partial [Penicillium viridicatum]
MIKHPQCIPWDLPSDYSAPTLSHLSKNTHEKTPVDLGAPGLLRDPPPRLSHGGYGEMVVERERTGGRREEEEEKRK